MAFPQVFFPFLTARVEHIESLRFQHLLCLGELTAGGLADYLLADLSTDIYFHIIQILIDFVPG